MRRHPRDRSANTARSRMNEYFIPREGIDREVIATDICRYLGNDALVRPGHYENPQTGEVVQGYYITAYRNITTDMIESLKADSARWDVERRARTNPLSAQYRYSEAHNSRQVSYEPSSAPGSYARGTTSDGPGYQGAYAPRYGLNYNDPFLPPAPGPESMRNAGYGANPQQATAPKNVAFELLFPDSTRNRDFLPFRVQIFPHDTAESVAMAVKDFYGLYSGPSGSKNVRFEDHYGNIVIARYDTVQDNMVIYVRVVEDTPGVANAGSRYEEDSNRSLPESSLFDRVGSSRATHPTTLAASQPKTRAEAEAEGLLVRSTPGIATEAVQHSVSPETGDFLSEEIDARKGTSTPDVDIETSYSLDSTLDDHKLYLQAFSDQLSRDLSDIFNDSMSSGIEREYLETALKRFAWKLHRESSNPFQWEACVTLHRRRRGIVELLSRAAYVEGGSAVPGDGSSVSEVESGDGEPERERFQKSKDKIFAWISGVELSPVHDHWSEDPSRNVDELPLSAEDEPLPFQFADYEHFVRKSGAYQWLLSKIRQHGQLRWAIPDSMSEIGTEIQNQLRAQDPLRKISRRKPLSTVTMTLSLDWNPAKFFRDQGLDPTNPAVLERVLCLTGTLGEAQATTVVEYMTQTWPETGEPIINLIKELVSLQEGEECFYELPESHATQLNRHSSLRPNIPQLRARINGPSSCSICITGGPYFVSEIAEQLGWLASALRCPPAVCSRGVVICTPSVKDIQMNVEKNETPTAAIKGSCRVVFDFKQHTGDNATAQPAGFCWSPLLWNPILVSGYPILRRPESNTGLEMSLRAMAFLIRSQQVVQWDERIIMKGFSSLAVATLATSGVIVWHLLVNGSQEERISYTDPEIDKLRIRIPEGFSLRSLEGRRHILGWCANSTDICGRAIAGLNVGASGLLKPPASIVIDRLYIEGGTDFVGGISMSLNKKDQPFSLAREKDYPSLLKWASLQLIIFYDVSDRRAWLVDGASALLHLVRISLHLDEHDPESTYDWVFDHAKLKDNWDGCTGRHASLKTLKNWDNLDLNLYILSKRIRDGETVTEYSTLEARVKKILQSLEILIDRQVKVVSQDGIRIPQTLDPRKSIAGFDILDVITPLGPVHPRIQHLDSWGPGWRDLVPALGITTIFGSGFGDLIRPDDPTRVCSKWRSVPTGLEYMAASVSTLRMLQERRLARMEPGLGVGELARKVVWLSPCEPLKSCECVEGSQLPEACHRNPVQFLVSKRPWNPRFMSRPMTPLDVMTLGNEGAVIFGHVPLFGFGRDGNDRGRGIEESDPFAVTSSSASTQGSGVRRTLGLSAAGSATASTLSQASTPPTVPSAVLTTDDDKEDEGEGREESSAENPSAKRRKLTWRLKKRTWR